ncbi:TraB/GumN family protein [Stenotrophomonas sp. 24(2023)]|uniref:TraB/GumN family protein n=1 Tax=Stenotrophomonas sp. 24(2023) TaxID=3068324 RepID=UPI0027DFEF13|nr:TraB/GumN family protein [Stenotrophomonas sp. 24(2023)]WMJ68395.1 TraB/GumN family protein [Stenotrophomonas sp. 24(2023)]
MHGRISSRWTAPAGAWAVALQLALAGAVAAAPPTPAPPAVPPAVVPPVVDLATLQVTGEQPGPGLWKVTTPQGHVLSILGTVTPIPAGVQWRSDEVRQAIAGADHVLGSPGWTLDMDVGFFKGLTLLPLARSAMRDPEGRTLQQQLPAATYARWEGLKQSYLGRDRGVEKERPMIASGRLYTAFLKGNGLRNGSEVSDALKAAYKARGLKSEDTRLKLKVDDARAALKEMQATDLDDAACFERTLDVVEFQAPVLRERANAWALGDVAALRRLSMAETVRTCVESIEDSSIARRRGWTNLEARGKAQWLAKVDAALATHAQTFATVPVSLLVGPSNYIDALVARGYQLEAPPE